MSGLVASLRQIDPVRVRARNVWCEARGEGLGGMIAVDWVVLNRDLDPRWPDGPVNVILQAGQFAWTRRSDPNYRLALEPWRHDARAWELARQAVKAVDNGEPDPTLGANHYLNPRACRRLPRWYDRTKVVAVIGRHHFLRL
jgi:N-acetylmuramoyl-L-alanine amidase